MGIMRWKPWEDYKDTVVREIPIQGPPCVRCHFWRPITQVMQTSQGPLADGVRLCQKEEMYHDFSCFTPIKTEAD